MDEIAEALYKALHDLHTCHRAFSGTKYWTVLDDEARAAAEAALAAYEDRTD